VISGLQPGTATLYDKDANPIFEFGKRYRNTVRICPYSEAIMIGGFGNLAGEVDVWSNYHQTEVGNFKSYCTVGVDWSPDGKYIMTCSTFPRMKVDNEIKIFNPLGKLICEKSYKDGELYDAIWQKYDKSNFEQPDLFSMAGKEEEKKQSKPKKLFAVAGGGNNTFA
jgi:translation initiation factor 2A